MRYASAGFDTIPPATFDLMPQLTAITLTDHGGSWSTLPDGDVTLSIVSHTGVASRLDLTASQSWLGPQTALTFDLQIPGYLPEWTVDTSLYERSLQVAQYANGVSLGSGWYEAIGLAARTAPPRTARVQQLRQLSGARRKIVP